MVPLSHHPPHELLTPSGSSLAPPGPISGFPKVPPTTGSSLPGTMVFVTVVPMLAPMMMGMASTDGHRAEGGGSAGAVERRRGAVVAKKREQRDSDSASECFGWTALTSYTATAWPPKTSLSEPKGDTEHPPFPRTKTLYRDPLLYTPPEAGPGPVRGPHRDRSSPRDRQRTQRVASSGAVRVRVVYSTRSEKERRRCRLVSTDRSTCGHADRWTESVPVHRWLPVGVPCLETCKSCGDIQPGDPFGSSWYRCR